MKVIITGSTGMVGRSTLNECLASSKVDEVLVINRRELGQKHPKLKELVHQEFMDFDDVVGQLKGYDACFHCMGVSSVGMDESQFAKYTIDITKALADACYAANPQMIMNYVSGTGTDSTEKGNTMWARIKGKTENYILNQGFKDAYMFRLGILIPEGNVRSGTNWYRYLYIALTPLFPLLKKMKGVVSSSRFGQAMINTVLHPQSNKHLENKDINAMAQR